MDSATTKTIPPIAQSNTDESQEDSDESNHTEEESENSENGTNAKAMQRTNPQKNQTSSGQAKVKEPTKLELNTIKKFIGFDNIDKSMTCDFYSNLNIHPEKIQEWLSKTSNHGLTGIKNLNNQSYATVIFQCLSHCPDWVYYYLSDWYEKDWNSRSTPKGGKLGLLNKSFKNLLSQLWWEDNKVIVPSEIRYAICDKLPVYSNTNQHDSYEFLMRFMDTWHSEINRPILMTNFTTNEEAPKNDNETDYSASKRFWNYFKQSNNSVYTSLFYGQWKNTMKCLACAYNQVTFEPFSILPWEIPRLKKINVWLIPSNNIKDGVMLTLFISDTAWFIDIGVYIKQYIQKGFDIFKVLLFNFPNSGVKFVKMSENIFNASKKGMIIIYEIGDSIYDNINDDDNLGDENEDSGDYYPFITMLKDSDNKVISYPRVFPVNSYSKVKSLRVRWYGYLRKYNPPSELITKYLGDKYMKLNKDNDQIDDTELMNIYESEYNLIFTNNSKRVVDEAIQSEVREYLTKFKFKCYLASLKPGAPDMLVWSNDIIANNNEFNDNQSIQSIIDHSKNNYKIIVQLLNEDSVIINDLNNITSICAKQDTEQASSSENQSDSPEKIATLNDALINYSLHEKLEKGNEWYCPRCHKLQNAYKKLDLFYLPKYFMIGISRYERTFWSKTKIQLLKKNDLINYAVENWNLEKFVLGPQTPKPIFDWFGTVQHSGSNEGGHYVSTCKNFGKWYLFDDRSFFECDEDMVCSKEGYILFYKKVKEKKGV